MSKNEVYTGVLRSDFFAFVSKAFHWMHGESLESEYVEYLCEMLRPYADGDKGLLIVNLPPRHLKTFIFAVCLTAWVMGHHPKTRVLVIAGSEKLANVILGDLHRLMSSEWYRKLFGVDISKASTKTEIATSAGGVVLASSIWGNFTGLGGELIIVDDAASVSDAGDSARLEEVNTIFDNLVMSRRNNARTARVIVIAHRLAEKDLSGHLLEGEGWEHICLPLIAEKDEPLEVEDYFWTRKAGELLRPDAFDEDELENLKSSQGAPGFDALYQQNPGGRSFPPLDPGCLIQGGGAGGGGRGGAHVSLPVVISVDPAQSTQADRSYFVAQVWVKNFDGRHILIDQVRKRIGYDDQRRHLLSLGKRHMPSMVLIENNAGAGALERLLLRAGYNVKLVSVGNRSKRERFAAHVELIRQGKIVIGDRVLDADEFVEEVVSFPKVDYDDQVDALTQYLDYVTSGEVIPPRRQRAIGVVARPGW